MHQIKWNPSENIFLNLQTSSSESVEPGITLVEVDDQMDQPKSEVSMECCHVCAALFFDIN